MVTWVRKEKGRVLRETLPVSDKKLIILFRPWALLNTEDNLISYDCV